ncbi:head fiber protein [Paenibacillus sp. Root52]|uniref:head fiber protein n=1 Tax=Paenibacillus sp. Root52 TaxID=1736552 RepID=UPI001EF30BDE|nr:head fiber protein [Paenibacillus sp. Root52]
MMPINHSRQPNYQRVIPAAEAPRLPEKREADYVVFVDEDGAPVDLGGGGSGSQAAAQADSTATTIAGLVADFNSLLAKLRAAGIIAS